MFGHAVNIQTNMEKKRAMFSNIKIPIAHQIRSDQYLFSCWWLFFSLDIVCCCYCDCFYCFFSFSGYLQILSERDRLLLLTILQFYFLLCRDAAGTFVFFLFIRLLILRRRHSFFFSDNSISHLTNALTLANNGIEKKIRFFFHLHT